MATDNKTFSAIVDSCLAETRHPGKLSEMTRFMNSTLRELDITGDYRRSLVEDTITATASPHIWTPPVTLRKLRTVRYTITDIYPPNVRPGKRINDERLHDFYYAASNYYTFSGVEVDHTIDIAYYNKPRWFLYYALAARPATWDAETEAWSYLTAGTDAEKEIARDLVTHWLLEDWSHVVIEGAKAKFFKQFNDERAGSTFALFSQFKKDLTSGEEHESLGY